MLSPLEGPTDLCDFHLMILGVPVRRGGEESDGAEEPALEVELDRCDVIIPLRHSQASAGGEGSRDTLQVTGERGRLLHHQHYQHTPYRANMQS